MAAPHLDYCAEHEDCIVTYVGHKCPICELQEEKEAAEERADEAEGEVAELRAKP